MHAFFPPTPSMGFAFSTPMTEPGRGDAQRVVTIYIQMDLLQNVSISLKKGQDSNTD